MATYKGIQGYSIRSLSSDPDTLSDVVGQIWYNSSIGKFKLSVQGAAAWSSGGALNRAKASAGCAGTATAAIVFGGNNSQTPAILNETEIYDGTAWTETNNLNTARREVGTMGTVNTAVVCAAGSTGPGGTQQKTETWNGTSWTEGNNMTRAREGMQGFGTSTAGVCAGGIVNPGATAYKDVETYDGTSWTEEGDLNTYQEQGTSGGSSTAGIVYGGYSSSGPPWTETAATQIYDGTSWAAGNNMSRSPVQTSYLSGFGDTTAAVACGGGYPARTTVEVYDGTSWAAGTAMTTARRGSMGNHTGNGSIATGLGAGGYNPADATITTTEEYANAPVTSKTVTVT